MPYHFPLFLLIQTSIGIRVYGRRRTLLSHWQSLDVQVSSLVHTCVGHHFSGIVQVGSFVT